MPIRAQCDNCGKVYNLPDESAGKRLRCKQCAVAFTVPGPSAAVAAAAPTVSVSVPAVQKVCVVCGQDVAGKPRTKDQSGNYYCKACYEEKARAREQVAVPVGVGAGDGGGDGDMIDLAALEGAEAVEQLDYSAQPPPPPIPDMDMVSEPIPGMEPEVIEAPKPKKKKKKPVAGVKGKPAKAAAGDSFMSKLTALPPELYIVGVAVLIAAAGMISSTMAGFAFIGLVVIGLGTAFWGKICIVMAAFAEGTMTGIMYLFVPFYWLIFLLSNWADLQRHVIRVVLGIALIIGGGFVMGRHGDSGDGDEDEAPRARSRSARAAVDDENSATAKDETSTAKNENSAAKTETPAAQNQNAATPEAEEIIKLTVNLRLVRDFEDEERDKKEDEISEVILKSLQQRGIKPPQGQYYRVEAMVEPNRSTTRRVTLAGVERTAPILNLKLRVKDSIGRGNYIFDKGTTIEVPPDVIEKASKVDSNTAYEAIIAALWKDVPREFKAMMEEFTPPGAAAANPATNPPPVPTGTAAPAK